MEPKEERTSPHTGQGITNTPRQSPLATLRALTPESFRAPADNAPATPLPPRAEVKGLKRFSLTVFIWVSLLAAIAITIYPPAVFGRMPGRMFLFGTQKITRQWWSWGYSTQRSIPNISEVVGKIDWSRLMVEYILAVLVGLLMAIIPWKRRATAVISLTASNQTNGQHSTPELTATRDIQPSLKHTKVGGWLALLCFSLVIGGPIRFLLRFSEWEMFDKSELAARFPTLLMILWVDVGIGFILILFGVYAGLRLGGIKRNAVKITKRFLIIALAYQVLIIPLTLLGDPSPIIFGNIVEQGAKDIVQGFIYTLIWYLYLNKSKRVKEMFSSA